MSLNLLETILLESRESISHDAVFSEGELPKVASAVTNFTAFVISGWWLFQSHLPEAPRPNGRGLECHGRRNEALVVVSLCTLLGFRA